MAEQLSPEEVAFLIRARQLLKDKGLSKDIDVKAICDAAGISRKTGYNWAKKLNLSDEKRNLSEEELARLKKEYEDLKKRYRRLSDINEGRRLAWEIHGLEEPLYSKKKTSHQSAKRKGGDIFANKFSEFARNRMGFQSLLQCVEWLG